MNDNKKWIRKIAEEFAIIRGLSRQNIPLMVYKYTKFDINFLEIIFQNNLYFSSPSKFNDVFDCNFNIINGDDSEEIQKFITQFASNDGNMDKIFEKKEKLVSRIKILYKTLIDERIGIACLSESNNNEKMWYYYADKFKGVCIGFDATKDTDSFLSSGFKIKYVEKYPPKIKIGDDMLENIKKIVSCKLKMWEDEKEFRLFQMQSGFYDFNPKIITKIIIGHEFVDDPKNRSKLKLLESIINGREILLLKTKINRDKNIVEFEEI